MVQRLLQPARLEQLLANLLDDSSAAVRERQAHPQALRTELMRVDRAIQNMFDFIEQGVVSPRDTHFTAPCRPAHPSADLEQEIGLVERQLSATEHHVTPDAIVRLGDITLRKLRSNDPVMRQGYARRFIDKVVVAPDTITISGAVKPLELAISQHPNQMTPAVPSLDREWCRLQDLNL